jgi:hypothetical protein
MNVYGGLSGGINVKWVEERKGYGGLKRMEISYIYLYETLLKGRERRRGRETQWWGFAMFKVCYKHMCN